MKKIKQPLLGVCSIGKFVFSHEDALVQKKKLFKKLDQWKINYCHIDTVLSDGLVRDQKHVKPVVEFFRARGIDGLFIPHCNFGTEGAAGMIAKECGVPVVLWGPRDEAPKPDGTRLRDSLCGVFATSKVLHTLKVPFSYINNCAVDDSDLKEGVENFYRATRVVKAMKTMRIGQIGQRIDFFWSTIVSEVDLLRKFGIQVLPIDLTDFISRVKCRIKKHQKIYRGEWSDFKKIVELRGYDNEDEVLVNFALRDELIELGEENQLDAFALQTFSSIPNELGSFTCLGVGLANDTGYPVAPESDLHGAVSALLIEAAGKFDAPSFIPDITIRHPQNDNAVLLWHVEAGLSLRDPDSPVTLDRPWILDKLPTGMLNFKLKNGLITLCRFDGDGDSYRLGFGEGKTIDGPYTKEFYTWMEVNDWYRWERQLVEGPYIHHCACVFDHCAKVLKEAGRFIPNLQLEEFGTRQMGN